MWVRLSENPGYRPAAVLPEGSRRSEAPRDPDHVGYIDALRGVAFLLVLFYHCLASTRGLPTWFVAIVGKGNYGVQLFYVASAFTLFLSLKQRAERDVRPVLFFFIRRVFRIAPMFWAAILFYVLYEGLAPRASAPLGLGASHILTTALFLHGWHPSTINSVVPGGWSIAVEMTFYLMVPFFFHHVRSLRRMVPIFLALLLASRIASWVAHRWLLRSLDPRLHDCATSFVYYWLPAQMPVFCLGFILFFLVRSPSLSALAASRTRKRWSHVAMVAAALSAGGLVVARLPMAFIGFSVVGLIVAVGLTLHENRLLVNRFTRYAGKVSYSAYLAHFAVVDAITDSGMWNRARLSLPPLLQYLLYSLGVLALTLLVSTLTYRFIEEPGRSIGRRLIHRMQLPRHLHRDAVPPLCAS